MQPSFDEIRQLAQELPADQRMLLAHSLWESTAMNEAELDEAALNAAWAPEIAQRISEMRAGTAKTCTLEELEQDLAKIVGQ